MPMFFCKATGFKSYKPDFIKAENEELAKIFYAGALREGFVPMESEEFEFEICEEPLEETHDEKESKL